MSQDISETELISMEEAIERLKTTRPTFYRWLRSGRIKGMKVGRQWRFYADDLERFLKGEGPRVDLPLDISPLLADLRRALQAAGSEDFADELEGAERALEMMLNLAVINQASHLHLENQVQPEGEVQASLRLRIEGPLKPVLNFDKRLLNPLLSHFKSLAGCDPHNQTQPQEGQFKLEHEQGSISFKAHFLPSLNGEALTLSLLRSHEIISLDKLRLNPQIRQQLDKALSQGWGMVVTSGPTGSGKTTTLYAALHAVASAERKSISLEAPVETVFPWVVPVSLEADENMTSKLRSLLQADPDVLMIGELREAETLQLALRIALTGHLVLTQLHSESALQALLKLIEVSGSAYTVTESVKLVLNQRLVRRLCPHCKQQQSLNAEDRKRFEPLRQKLGTAWEQLSQIPKAAGCASCQQTGYRGRLQLTEALELNPELRQRLLRQPTQAELEAWLEHSGWRSFLHDGLDKVLSAETTLEELARVAGLF